MANEVIKYPGFLDELSDIFAQKNHTLYIVGGYVRDAIMGRVSDDIDICSDMHPDKVYSMLESYPSFTIGQRNLPMGTMIINHKGVSLEYTAFRKESYRGDGTHTPHTVSLSATINEDALRRDFACNSIYYDIRNKKLIDFFNGINDIEIKVLRTPRKPKKVFTEDALRILRMARISAETMFLPDDAAMESARSLKDSLKMLSKERISREIEKLLISDTKYSSCSQKNIKQGMDVLFECNAAQTLFDGILKKHALKATDAKSYQVKVALFISECDDLKKALYYTCPNSDIRGDVKFLLNNIHFHDAESVDLLAQHGYRRGMLLAELLEVLERRCSLLEHYTSNMQQKDYIISMKTLAISGNDIKKTLKVADSPLIGKIKIELLKHIIKHPENNNKQALISYIKNNY